MFMKIVYSTLHMIYFMEKICISNPKLQDINYVYFTLEQWYCLSVKIILKATQIWHLKSIVVNTEKPTWWLSLQLNFIGIGWKKKCISNKKQRLLFHNTVNIFYKLSSGFIQRICKDMNMIKKKKVLKKCIGVKWFELTKWKDEWKKD
jgi:hypothetical protein